MAALVLSSLTWNAASVTFLSGVVTTSGDQIYDDAIILTGDTTLVSTAGGNIAFQSTVDGPYALTILAGGVSIFNGAVGSSQALISLTTATARGTALNGRAVTTVGSQTYDAPVVLGADFFANSLGGGSIVFNSTVDGMQSLVLMTAGPKVINGPVGGTTALLNLTTDGGSMALNGGTVTTIGAQTYNGAVMLGSELTLASLGAGDILFNSTVDGMHSLTVASGGIGVFNGSVGGGTALASLVTDTGASTMVNGGAVTTTGVQDYRRAVTLANNATLTASQVNIFATLTLAGAGTIAAALGNTGRIVVNGGTLRFMGDVINSGTILAGTGAVLDFVAPVFNHGVIDALAGRVLFRNVLLNNGIVVDSASLRLTKIRRVGADIRLTWATMGGHRYVLQTTAPSGGGGFTKSFSDLSPIISVTGNSQSTKDYTHVGGAAGSRARYYRVRLVD